MKFRAWILVLDITVVRIASLYAVIQIIFYASEKKDYFVFELYK